MTTETERDLEKIQSKHMMNRLNPDYSFSSLLLFSLLCSVFTMAPHSYTFSDGKVI